MFDIFYSGTKPNLFAHEQYADNIEHAKQLSRTRYFWWVNYLSDYSNHDFLWEPAPWESDQIHIWPSQHQENGGTYLVPKKNVADANRAHNKISRTKSVPVVGIDHGTGFDCEVDYRSRYISDYLGTLKRILSRVSEEYVWVISSVCDYTDFDFTWHPSEWQADMLHVFPSDEQKFGDTFYIHVPSFLKKSDNLALLEWFDTIHFVEDITVCRNPITKIYHNFDSQVPAVTSHEFTDPVVLFTDSKDIDVTVTMNLWREQTKTIIPLNSGASSVLVPRTAKNYITTQLYDYPYIDKSYKKTSKDTPQDIVFISYDEPDADANWNILYNKFPRAKRVHGVAGMELALEAAADVATTPWYFAVFAKTKLHEAFDFSFVPDRMQQPKHYIFNCRNSVNQLEYGHMGVVLYNCAGIKQMNQLGNFGLDYTMSFPNESIPILSCHGEFNTTPYHTWRTAFRESAKLAFFESQTPTIEGKYRLGIWQNQASGNHAEWCLKGSNDGVEFFQNTNGDLEMLKQSFKWEWLRNYFVSHYGDLK